LLILLVFESLDTLALLASAILSPASLSTVGSDNTLQALDRAVSIAEDRGDGSETLGRGFFKIRVQRHEELERLRESLNAFVGGWFAGFAHVPLTAFNLL
jgi:hypothetical protein